MISCFVIYDLLVSDRYERENPRDTCIYPDPAAFLGLNFTISFLVRIGLM